MEMKPWENECLMQRHAAICQAESSSDYFLPHYPLLKDGHSDSGWTNFLSERKREADGMIKRVQKVIYFYLFSSDL